MRSYPVRVTKRGVITLPAPVRCSLKIREGSILTLLDLDGALVLVPQILRSCAAKPPVLSPTWPSC